MVTVWVNIIILGGLEFYKVKMYNSNSSQIQKCNVSLLVRVNTNCSWLISAKPVLEMWKEATFQKEVIFVQAWRLGHATAVILMDSLQKCVIVLASNYK